MPELTDQLVVVANALKGILEDAQEDLGLEDVFYGDLDRIPRSPAACIETGEKTRELEGAPRRTLVTMPVYIFVYHNALKAASDDQKEENDLLSEAIETEIHKYPHLGGLVIHGMCTALEPGYEQKQDNIWQVTRITYEATSKVMLPYSDQT